MTRARIVTLIERISRNTKIVKTNLITFLGLPRSTYFDWQHRVSVGRQQNSQPVHPYRLTPEEQELIAEYSAYRDYVGVRRLAWMMVDRDVVYVAPSTVQKYCKRSGKRSRPARFNLILRLPTRKPKNVHDVWVADFVSLYDIGDGHSDVPVAMDAFSRFLLFVQLDNTDLSSHDAIKAKTRSKYPGIRPRAFINAGAELIELELMATVEEMLAFSTAKQDGVITDPVLYKKTVDLSEVIKYYNTKRLNAALDYVTPYAVFRGQRDDVLSQRRNKLALGRKRRAEYWSSRRIQQNQLFSNESDIFYV